MDVTGIFALFLSFLLIGCGADIPLSDSMGSLSDALPPAVSVAPEPEPTPQPGALSGMIVCLDPGHGVTTASKQEAVSPLSDQTKPAYVSGASGKQISESELNLQAAFRLRDQLESMGATVILTRETVEATVSNIERAQIANDAGADLCIRIHADGIDNPSVHGVSVLIPTGKLLGTPSIEAPSAALGELMVNAVAAQTGAKNRGTTERSDLTGFNWSEVPCVLLEMGFLSNPDEETAMMNPAYQDKIAAGVAEALTQWRAG